VLAGDRSAVSRAISAAELGRLTDADLAEFTAAAATHSTPVLGITGTGGSG